MSHELTIETRGAASNFEITVDGTIDLPTDDPIADGIIASGSTVEGIVDDGDIAVQFSGTLTDVTVSESATVFVDGEPVDPAEYWT